MLSGGTTVAPQVAAAGGRLGARGLLNSTARLAASSAKAGVTGAASGEIAGLTSEGTAAERLRAGNQGALVGAVTGVATPGLLAAGGLGARKAVSALRATGRGAARIANKASGGRLLNPELEAARRLGATMSGKDQLTPEILAARLQERQTTGASAPTLLDLVGENTRGLTRSAANKAGPARNAAVAHLDRVSADLQDNAIRRTSELVDDPRTLPELDDEIATRIGAATTAPTTNYGRAGSMAHVRLNEARDLAKGRVDEAYAEARAAAPEGAHLRSDEFPALRANIRESVRDFHPDDVPSVARELDALDHLSTPTIRDLYETRQRLTAVRLSKPEQSRAAAQAVRALDAQIDDAVERGTVTGDPAVVDLWKDAISKRRTFGQLYEGGDMIEKLTDRTYRGGAPTNRIAPEDASAVMFGRGAGVSPNRDATRDLARVRDRLGPESEEWGAAQEEAFGRVMARDDGREHFGQAWDDFAEQNPDLATMLMGEPQREALTMARQEVGDAVADRAAVQTGRGIMQTPPDRFAADLEAAGDRRGLSQVAGTRQLEEMIGRPAEGSTGILNRISSGTNPARRLDDLYGPEEGGRYRSAIGHEIETVRNARYISPNEGSKTASSLIDEETFSLPPTSKIGLLVGLMNKMRRGMDLTDGEREAMIGLMTRQIQPGQAIPSIPLQDGTRRLLTPAQRARIARTAASYTGASTGQQATGSPVPY